MQYSDLELTRNQETVEIDINGNIINVLQYLPIQDKIEIITQAVQSGLSYDVYIDTAIEAFSSIYTVIYYTDLEFTADQKENIFRLYDEMRSTGVLDKILSAIPKEELEDIYEGIFTFTRKKEEVDLSLAVEFRNLIEKLPRDLDEINKLMKDFDPSQYQQILDMAEGAGKR